MRQIVLACLILLAGARAHAEILTPLSYDMPNGDGVASGGTFNYWDAHYTGSGNTRADGSSLSGGLGALTDGVTSNRSWMDVEDNSGTGPFVGWFHLDPTITFHFANAFAYRAVRIHVDDSDTGGVSAPSAITVGDGVHSQTFPVTAPGVGLPPFWVEVDVSNLGLTGDQINVMLARRSDWVLADEVQFLGVSTPEPASLTLFGLGIIGILGLKIKRGWV